MQNWLTDWQNRRELSSAKILAHFATEEDDRECSQLGLNKFDDLILRN
jgi:hypothetical protein